MKLYYLAPVAELNPVEPEDLLTLSIGNNIPNIGEDKSEIDFEGSL